MTVAVLISNYNNGPWIRACVDSALAQTRPADEVIVYDDGSTDDSLAILRSYGPRIRLIEGRHDDSRPGRLSQRAAIFGAFAASTAEHVYLLDGDDAYLPHHLADYEAAWSASPEAVMLQGPMTRIDHEGRVIGPYHEKRKHRLDYLADAYRHHETEYFYLTSALAFRREFLTRVHPMLADIGADFAIDSILAIHAAFQGRIVAVPEPSVLYRVRAGSLADRHGLRSSHRVHETRTRTRCFNQIARKYGRPPIRAWRNPTYLQQMARLWLPAWLSAPFARLKAARNRSRR